MIEEGEHCVSDAEAQDFQKSKSEQVHHSTGFQNNGDVYAPLWCGDMVSDNFPDAVPPGYLRSDFMGQVLQS